MNDAKLGISYLRRTLIDQTQKSASNPILNGFDFPSQGLDDYTLEVLHDYWICCVSREVSVLGRKEVMTGKAKFAILGDGKEVPQVAMARAFKKGDWRSGYYRDQTFMMALGLCTVEQFFAQLYADVANDPWSGGRQMNAHFACKLLDNKGNWLDQTQAYNISADVSSTASQMSRSLGIALASKLYRNQENLADLFSKNGDEISFCTIGDASTSEGIFWETMNAAAVMQVPLAVNVWDDGYGISVPKALQTTHESISVALSGLSSIEGDKGIDIYNVKAWDYPGLVELYDRAIQRVRKNHIPALIHVEECTQPLGHSTSGSHERYKSQERLSWELKADGIEIMGKWIAENGLSSIEDLFTLREKAKMYARDCKNRAWKLNHEPIKEYVSKLKTIVGELPIGEEQQNINEQLTSLIDPNLSEIYKIAQHYQFEIIRNGGKLSAGLMSFLGEMKNKLSVYGDHLYSSSNKSALKIPAIEKIYAENSKKLPGYKILNNYFDSMMSNHPEVVVYGEDVGKIGDVNQGFAGLQEKYGISRIFDTGIREWSIMGKSVGLAMRGLRPIAEIQYLDYLIYGLEPLTDDLSTVRYRSNGAQMAPALIRTRGHRLEGIWHAGSPLGLLLSSLRGMYIMVPRNMVQAAGFYNTMLKSDDPGIIIECLNAYRIRERMPSNLSDFTLPLGIPEILVAGQDISIVTYGTCVRIAMEAIDILNSHDISVELIDVQSLLPFDIRNVIVDSLKKTNRVVFLDEDIPGGASSYMMQQVLEEKNGYQYLDHPPVTITAKEHRTPYGSDGDYFAKPNAEQIFKTIYSVMHQSDPKNYPYFFENID